CSIDRASEFRLHFMQTLSHMTLLSKMLVKFDDVTPAELEAFLVTLARDDGAAARSRLAWAYKSIARQRTRPPASSRSTSRTAQLGRFGRDGERVLGDVRSDAAD
ncbi:hypothetical protein, partial [Ralstonia solanacearum]|uniref:hypothetical protein n=1 Tax=Ralstonia solanacearum TaxID=305 RepID=UPI001C714E29